MQFSLAAGSESAARERKKMSDPIMARQLLALNLFQLDKSNALKWPTGDKHTLPGLKVTHLCPP